MKYLHLIILITTMTFLVGCSEKTKKYVIGVSQCSEDIWRDKLNEELKTGEYLNDSLEVRLASSNDDSKRQIAQINKFIDERVDLLIVSPNQLNTISKAIDRAYDKGIPVVLYDRKTNSDKYTAFIGCDNYTIGKSMGNFIVQQLKGKGKIVEIRGLKGSSPAIERHRGFMDAIRPYPGIQLVASDDGDWKEESGTAAMKRILVKTQDFDYVFSHNDRMAWGAYLAAKQMGVKRLYRYTGVDAMATKGGGIELVRDGVFAASYLYPTKGDEVISLAMKILRHQPFERDNYLRTSIITNDNAELTLMEAKDSERQKHNLDMLHRRVDQYMADYHAQKLLTIGLVFFLVFVAVAAVAVYRSYILKVRLSEQLSKKNEELKRLNNEVLELTHSRLVFFTNISHELRTPLTLIIDPIDQLMEDSNIRGKSRELLSMVKRNAVALQQLVGAILDFRKVQNGKMALRLSRFDLVKNIHVWAGDFEPTAQRKNIMLHIDTDDYTQGLVVADEEKIARIVFNLMSNALKYSNVGGQIWVILSDEPDDKFSISVRDTGKGIAKDEQGKVFERFFQAKGAIGGTGIGLAVVKAFAELHHGQTLVESEEGKGATFRIVLPCVQEGEVEEVPRQDYHADEVTSQYVVEDGVTTKGQVDKIIAEHIDKPTLLIVDDNSDIREYERSILQDNYFILEAADGKQGWDMAQREVPDLVICDVMMPVMDGLQFCEKLKTSTATSHIPVIMLTAKNLEEQRAEGYEHGADSYITKPFSSKVLLARVQNLLQSRKDLRQLFGGVEKETPEMASMDDRDKLFIKQLHDIIKQHLGDSDFNVESIGPMIGLSRVQLYRKVKAITGSSVVDLIRKARLAKARRLIEGGRKSISEVAYEVGFSSPSYFTKCFKDEFGMKPGDLSNS